MPLDAFALALGSAFLHAFWNLILGRERDPEAATVVALCVSVIVFAPAAFARWDADSGVWPYIAVTSMLQLAYFALLATAYRHGDVSVVYPVARGIAPVLVLVVGVTVLGTTAGASQAVGVCLVGVGVLLVRGVAIAGGGRGTGAAYGVAVASCIAAYTLVDKYGIEHADPVVYLELSMVPATLGTRASCSPCAARRRASALPHARSRRSRGCSHSRRTRSCSPPCCARPPPRSPRCGRRACSSPRFSPRRCSAREWGRGDSAARRSWSGASL